MLALFLGLAWAEVHPAGRLSQDQQRPKSTPALPECAWPGCPCTPGLSQGDVAQSALLLGCPEEWGVSRAMNGGGPSKDQEVVLGRGTGLLSPSA